MNEDTTKHSTPKARGALPKLDYSRLHVDLYLPFDHGIHPRQNQARLCSQHWVDLMQLIAPSHWTTYTRAAFDELAARDYPHVGFTTLILMTDFITTLFALDDLIDHQASCLGRRPQQMEALKSYLEQAVRGDQPGPFTSTPYAHALTRIAHALYDISRRLLTHSHPEQLYDYQEAVSGYLGACRDEALMHHGRQAPIASLRAYANLRIHSTAVNACLELPLIAEGISLSPNLRQMPLFRLLWDSANLSVAYINDLFSYNKDITHGHTTNLLIVLQALEGLSPTAAFERARVIHNETVATYLRTKYELESLLHTDADWHFLIVMLESWMRGSYLWSVPGKNDRYTHCTSIATLERATPSSDRSPQPAITSI